MRINLNQIDVLAETACSLMSADERAAFLAESTSTSPTYIKGARKGQDREVFHVDGKKFNQIWKLVTPYVFTAAKRSTYNPSNLDDNIEEVKMLIFRYLRFFGPHYQNQPLSKKLPLLVNNALTNQFHKNSKLSEMGPMEFETAAQEEEVVNTTEFDNYQVKESQKETNQTEILASLPSSLQKVAELLMQGVALNQVAEMLGRDVIELRKDLQTKLNYLRN